MTGSGPVKVAEVTPAGIVMDDGSHPETFELVETTVAAEGVSLKVTVTVGLPGVRNLGLRATRTVCTLTVTWADALNVPPVAKISTGVSALTAPATMGKVAVVPPA